MLAVPKYWINFHKYSLDSVSSPRTTQMPPIISMQIKPNKGILYLMAICMNDNWPFPNMSFRPKSKTRKTKYWHAKIYIYKIKILYQKRKDNKTKLLPNPNPSLASTLPQPILLSRKQEIFGKKGINETHLAAGIEDWADFEVLISPLFPNGILIFVSTFYQAGLEACKDRHPRFRCCSCVHV